MQDTTTRRGPSRLLSALVMGAVSVGLVLLSGWWYTAARQPYLTTHDVAISVEGAADLPATEADMTTYGILSAARALDEAGQPTGYVIIAQRTGYKSAIRVQCTFAGDGSTLAGIRILSQDETEYLGSRITADSFTSGFAGRRLPVKLWTTAAPGSPVDGLTGSTISAQAVVDAVNNAYAFLQNILAA